MKNEHNKSTAWPGPDEQNVTFDFGAMKCVSILFISINLCTNFCFFALREKVEYFIVCNFSL